MGGMLIPVIVATIIAYVIGMLWYSPILFGKQWLKITKKDSKKMKMNGKVMLSGLIATFIFIWVFDIVIAWSGAETFMMGAGIGLTLWAGFVATLLLNGVLYNQGPIGLYLINSLHYLVIMLINGGLLAVWN